MSFRPLLPDDSPFSRWTFDDGTDVVSRSITSIDGIPVCVEQWRLDRTHGESIVIPGHVLGEQRDDEVVAWLEQHVAIASDRIVGRERGYLAIHHGFTRT